MVRLTTFYNFNVSLLFNWYNDLNVSSFMFSRRLASYFVSFIPSLCSLSPSMQSRAHIWWSAVRESFHKRRYIILVLIRLCGQVCFGFVLNLPTSADNDSKKHLPDFLLIMGGIGCFISSAITILVSPSFETGDDILNVLIDLLPSTHYLR